MVLCALVCITKNEKRYMEEYISYYLKLGFDTIFLYDNSNNFELKNFDRPPSVKVIKFPGPSKQIMAYNHFLLKYKRRYDYVAFFDSDEFLVLKKHANIQDFCSQMIPNGAIGINWYIFGNNAHLNYFPDLVIRRFTKRNTQMSSLVKTIAKCSDILSMNIHNPKLMNGPFLNCRHGLITGANNYDTDDSMAQINHYCTKSNEEYLAKINRGRGAVPMKRKYQDLEPYLYLNHVEDFVALDFYLNQPQSEQIAIVSYKTNENLNESIVTNPIFKYSFFYFYHPNGTSFSTTNPNVVYIGETRENYQNHFLIYFKNKFSHVLFLEENETIGLDPAFTDIQSFCLSNIKSGAIYVRSKYSDKIRILAKCRDLLEIQFDSIRKLGFREEIKENNLIWIETS